MAKTVVIIPARGGSKGIPRKNLRPLAGKPLIAYAIQAALNAGSVSRVVVSTEDDEIALISERLGAHVIRRPAELANDVATLDPVIVHAVKAAEQAWNEQYDHVITVQPTSPLIESSDIERGIAILASTGADSVVSVVDDRHLNWTVEEGKARPLYQHRVNRQQLPANFRETGAVIGCRRDQIESGTRIGRHIELLEIDKDKSFDVDSFSDLFLCEAVLSRKRIVFTVVGYPKVGLGHAYRTTMLANELVSYDLVFVCEERSSLAADFIRAQNYTVVTCADGELAQTVIGLDADLVINDILDTEADYIHRLKGAGIKVVNFEDMGSGYLEADMVVNALYPHQLPSEHVLVGAKYFCLRDEFLLSGQRPVTESVKRILVSFGGVDEGDLTCRVLDLIAPECMERGIAVDVVVGPGYNHSASLDALLARYPGLENRCVKGTTRISDFMLAADLAFTSGGRTVLELAALHVPMVVICQNQRETTHTFASSDNGIVNLGHRLGLEDEQIVSTFRQVVDSAELRGLMCRKMSALDLRKGKDRVIRRIKSLLV